MKIIQHADCFEVRSEDGSIVRQLALAALTAAALANSASKADLVGTSVTGGLFAGNATNLFDPINGHVPLGFSNTAGTTVTVVNPGVEFGFQDPANTITVDITSSQIIITDVLITNGTNGALTFTLKDSAFSNISSVSDNFAGGDFSLVGDTFTFTTSSFPGPGTFNAVFNVGAVLEPSTWAMMILGFAGVGYMAYRRRKSAMLAA